MSFAEKIAMATLLRWQEANNNVEIWHNKEENILLPFAQEIYNDFLRQIKIEMKEGLE